jgi:RimJ/RimL family protein N-acetyltransferase
MQPILLDVPDVIRTARLTVRCPKPGDGQRIYKAIVDSLDGLRQFPASLPWAVYEPSIDASEEFARLGYANFAARRDFPFVMLLRDTETVVGGGGIHDPRWSIPSFEVGWWGRTAYLGQGLISEGVEALMSFAFDALGARRVEAWTDDLNERSCKLCERVGMHHEGTLRHSRITPDGQLRDTRVYARLA